MHRIGLLVGFVLVLLITPAGSAGADAPNANEMKSKTVFAPKAGAVGAFVANGEAEIGVIQYQLLFSVPGIDIVGPLPGDLQDTTVFSGAILSTARDPAAARALISFFRSPEGAGVINAKGMEPGAP